MIQCHVKMWYTIARRNLKNVCSYSDNVLEMHEVSPVHKGNKLKRQKACVEMKHFGCLELQQSRQIVSRSKETTCLSLSYLQTASVAKSSDVYKEFAATHGIKGQ